MTKETPKDRLIREYREELETCRQLLVAAKNLILAAEGPKGGPTCWETTKRRWIELAEEHGGN